MTWRDFMRDREKETSLRTLPLAIVASLFLATSADAQVASVVTHYPGSMCHVHRYEYLAEARADKGQFGSPSSFMTPLCPIDRLQPTWSKLSVEVFFADSTKSDGSNTTTSVTCRLQSQREFNQGGNSVTQSTTGVWPSAPLYLSLTSSLVGGESSFFNSMTAATPQWRNTVLTCEFNANIVIRGYTVTETQ